MLYTDYTATNKKKKKKKNTFNRTLPKTKLQSVMRIESALNKTYYKSHYNCLLVQRPTMHIYKLHIYNMFIYNTQSTYE